MFIKIYGYSIILRSRHPGRLINTLVKLSILFEFPNGHIFLKMSDVDEIMIYNLLWDIRYIGRVRNEYSKKWPDPSSCTIKVALENYYTCVCVDCEVPGKPSWTSHWRIPLTNKIKSVNKN